MRLVGNGVLVGVHRIGVGNLSVALIHHRHFPGGNIGIEFQSLILGRQFHTRHIAAFSQRLKRVTLLISVGGQIVPITVVEVVADQPVRNVGHKDRGSNAHNAD